MSLGFNLDGGRTQKVFVIREGTVGGEEWASVMTIIAHESQVDHRDLLLRSGRLTFGSLAMLEDGQVVFQHSFPLSNLDPNEFEVPLHTAASFGDELELELTGQNKF